MSGFGYSNSISRGAPGVELGKKNTPDFSVVSARDIEEVYRGTMAGVTVLLAMIVPACLNTLGYGLVYPLCTEDCGTEPHKCPVYPDINCSERGKFKSEVGPSAPKDFHLKDSNLSWTLPNDMTFRNVTGYWLEYVHASSSSVQSKCILVDFEGTDWQPDSGKLMTLPSKCIGMSPGRTYTIDINSLPLPSHGTKDIVRATFAIPSTDNSDNSTNWSPTIAQHLENAKAVSIRVTFNLRDDMRKYTVYLQEQKTSGLDIPRKKGFVKQGREKYGFAQFENIPSGEYRVSVKPEKKSGKHCLCVGKYPFCDPCPILYKTVHVNTDSLVQNTTELTESSETMAVASPKIKGIRQQTTQDRRNNLAVIMPIVLGVVVLCVLCILSLALWIRKKKSHVPAAERNSVNLDQESIPLTIVSPYPSTAFSGLGSNYIPEMNDWQSLASEESTTQCTQTDKEIREYEF